MDTVCNNDVIQPTHENARFAEYCRDLSGRRATCKPCPVILSKAARKNSFDRLRSNRITAVTCNSAEQAMNSTDDSASVQSCENLSEQRQQLLGEEKKKRLRKQAISFLLQLTKCLNTCKKEVYTLSPNFVRPNVNKLREAVDNALYVAEGVKELKIGSTSTLKSLTRSAATLSGLMHIPDSMHSTSTRSSHRCLLRVRRMLNLAVGVSEELHTYTWKIYQPVYWKPSLEVPFFLKPPSLVYNSSLHRDLLIDNLKKQLESPSLAVPMVEATTGKECDFVETCRSLRDTLNAEEKPQNLVVSLPLSKIAGQQQNLGGKRDNSLVSVANKASFLEYLSKSEKLIPPQHRSPLQSSKPRLTNISKEARKVSFDARRSIRITCNSKDSDYDSDPDTDDSGDSNDDSDISSEYSDGDSDDTANGEIDGSSQGSEQQRSPVRKLQQQTTAFLIQLTKCLNTCKKEVYALSPNLVRPNINKLREAINNAIYAAEEVKRLTITSSSTLKRLTQMATTVARLVHIRDSAYSGPTVKSSYRCLLRIRRFLNLAMRVAAVLHDYTEKTVSGEYNIPAKEKISQMMSRKTPSEKKKGEDMELDENSQLQTEVVDSPAYWKPSLEVPFFLKPANLVYDSSLHKDLLINNLKKQLECSSSAIPIVEVSPGKECDFVETCRSLRDTLNNDEKPQNLVVSLPLVKVPSSKLVNKESEQASVIPAVLHAQATNLRASESCSQFVLDDVVDVGVVKGRKVSTQSPDYDAEIGEMINAFLWKVRREVVEKQSSSALRHRRTVTSTDVLKGVKKQSTFKSSCKNRSSLYSSHSITAKG